NLDSGRPDGEFVYPMESPTCGVSEILWVGPGRLLVLERDSFAGREAKFKRIYLAKLGKATDVSALESLAEIREPIQILEKKLVVDLLDPALGLGGDRFPPKWEGMAWGDVQNGDSVLWLISDNDFVAKNPTWVLALKIPAVMLRN
ncbi:MAG: esterase-like activity of phytase family protein, partial [Gemmataceae bacterium]